MQALKIFAKLIIRGGMQMKKKLMISVALLAVLGAAVVGYFHFSYKNVFDHG